MDLDILPLGLDPWKVPALMPPPGVIPNFFNPESHATQTIVVCSVVTAAMILFLVVRMYMKLHLSHSVGWDDCKSSLGAFPKGENTDGCRFLYFRVGRSEHMGLPRIPI